MPACKISAKILTTVLVIAQFKYLTFDPLSGAKGVVYSFDTAMLIYRDWTIMVCSDKLLNIIALRKFDESLYRFCITIPITKTRTITQGLRGCF